MVGYAGFQTAVVDESARFYLSAFAIAAGFD